jgi:hypothetical protein
VLKNNMRKDGIIMHKMNALQLSTLTGAFIFMKSCLLPHTGLNIQHIYANNITNILEIAITNNHAHVSSFLVSKLGNKCISNFISNYYGMTSSAKLCVDWKSAANKIQALARRFLTRNKYYHLLSGNYTSFKKIWKDVVLYLRDNCLNSGETWSQLKSRFDIVVCDDSDAKYKNIAELMNIAQLSTDIYESTSIISGDDNTMVSVTVAPVASPTQQQQQLLINNIDFTADVVKWFNHKSTDVYFKQLFRTRILQLSDGQRSYALSKRLQHTGVCPLFETKLTKGVRILWTNIVRNERRSILVSCLFVYL